MMLSAEELLAGSSLTYDIKIPAHVLSPEGESSTSTDKVISEMSVKLRPLNVRDLQLISRASKDNDDLTSVLMVQSALIEPKLSVTDVNALHVGLLQYLLAEVNHISGIISSDAQMEDAVEDPLVKAAYVLASEFGWTPDQVSEMTLGQIMLSLQMLKEKRAVNG